MILIAPQFFSNTHNGILHFSSTVRYFQTKISIGIIILEFFFLKSVDVQNHDDCRFLGRS
jgi:hypothetical protein